MSTIFPLPFPSGVYSLRFYQTGTATASFSDNVWQFLLPDGSGNQAWSKGIRVKAKSGTIYFSFDGTTIHGQVLSGESIDYWDRYEAGIAIKGTGDFIVEAW